MGWGGNLGDLALSRPTVNSLFTCISVTGNAVFLSNDSALSHQVFGALLHQLKNRAFAIPSCKGAYIASSSRPAPGAGESTQPRDHPRIDG